MGRRGSRSDRLDKRESVLPRGERIGQPGVQRGYGDGQQEAVRGGVDAGLVVVVGHGGLLVVWLVAVGGGWWFGLWLLVVLVMILLISILLLLLLL